MTGGIGTGKSSVVRLLARLGAEVLDADAVTHASYGVGGAGARSLAAALGSQVLDASGAVDRAWLAERVFADPALKSRVEAIVHPMVLREMDRFVAAVPPERLAVLEVPLLFETGYDAAVASVVVVACAEETQLRRLLGRHPDWDEAAARRRIGVQMPLASKVARADHVLWNDGTAAELEEATSRLYDLMMAELEGGEP